MTQHTISHPPTRTTTRRTVAKGAAWAIPVVAVGVAAPAARASTTATCQWVINLYPNGSRQVVNNRDDQISFSVQIAPNNQQPECVHNNDPYPNDITVTVQLPPAYYTGAWVAGGPSLSPGSGTGSTATFVINTAGKAPGWQGQVNMHLTTQSSANGTTLPSGIVTVTIAGADATLNPAQITV